MLIALRRDEMKDRPSLSKQMHHLRARTFSERRGWRVNVSDGMEIDRFDQLDPLYICLLSPSQSLVGSVRLLPTNGDHMISEVFPEVMGGEPIIRQTSVWESSRFCVDTQQVRSFGENGLNYATRALLKGLFRTADDVGIENVISVYDIYVEKVLKRAGCVVSRLGPVTKYDDLRTVGGLFNVRKSLESVMTDIEVSSAITSESNFYLPLADRKSSTAEASC